MRGHTLSLVLAWPRIQSPKSHSEQLKQLNDEASREATSPRHTSSLSVNHTAGSAAMTELGKPLGDTAASDGLVARRTSNSASSAAAR
jgi:hypothetical protein